MFRNYLKVAFRNITRHKGYSAINIIGLAIGIAACLLLFMVIRYETSYDSFYKNYARIGRIITENKHADGITYNPGVPFPLLDAARVDYPQVKIAGINEHSDSQITVVEESGSNKGGEKKFIEERGLFFAEPEFLEMFEQQWLAGDPSVLKEPNTSVLTEKTAVKYFGSWQNAVGKSIKLDNRHVMRVGGVITDPPSNTDYPMSILSSYATLRKTPDYDYSTDWGSTGSNTQVYVQLPESISFEAFNQQLKGFVKKHYREGGRGERAHTVQPLNTVHFDARFGNFGDHVTSRATLWTLSFIGLLIIVMACINFVNLSTAQAVGRSREVGVRKVLGGNRLQLFWQMLGETMVIVGISLALALIIAKVVLPFLKNFVSIEETLPLFSVENVLFLLAVAVVAIILSGIYPALILSGFRPALALKNKITSASVGGISVRRGLVVMQFAISQVMIIGTIVALSQMSFIRNADIGFNKDATLVMNSRPDSAVFSRLPAFKAALQTIPGVQSVSLNNDVPSSDNNWGTNFAYDHKEDENYTLYHKFGDADYFKTYGLRFVAGRGFSQTDTTNEVVVNETFVKKLGIKDPASIIGKETNIGGGRWRPIVGVVQDFKTNSLRDEVKPIRIASDIREYTNTTVKMHTSNIKHVQDAVHATWDKFFPEYAFDSFFVDESITNFYRQEEQLSKLYKLFAGLAIFISCLGLYGLVSFMAVQKTKEVGIRKVLGASVGNIVYLFSKEFTLLIGIAFAIATPGAYFVMKNWLQDFAYRVEIGIGVFAMAIVVSLVIAWLTVGYKAVRAALVNPVKSLKTE